MLRQPIKQPPAHCMIIPPLSPHFQNNNHKSYLSLHHTYTQALQDSLHAPASSSIEPICLNKRNPTRCCTLAWPRQEGLATTFTLQVVIPRLQRRILRVCGMRDHSHSFLLIMQKVICPRLQPKSSRSCQAVPRRLRKMLRSGQLLLARRLTLL